ncbi:hypothetical protein [Streptomyces sp. NPDC090994]|uniref:hypothetical protein n=1 Tax=Streptomyces sp. NPDC090994 TaxID=3365969 RepID=UPI0037FA8258
MQEALTDGTLVTARQRSGDDRAGVWASGTPRADEKGFRVAVSAFDNSAVNAGPSRGAPAPRFTDPPFEVRRL